MSLQQYLEYQTSKMLEHARQQREQQLREHEQIQEKKLQELEREYKVTIEDEIARNVSRYKFLRMREHNDLLLEKNHKMLSEAYLKAFEDIAKTSEFQELFIHSFHQTLESFGKNDWKIQAYGKYAATFADLAKKLHTLDVEVSESDDMGGIRAVSKDIEIDYSLSSLLQEAQEEILEKVFPLLFE